MYHEFGLQSQNLAMSTEDHSFVKTSKECYSRREITDLDKAVMKMQPDQGCCHPGLPGHRLRYDGLHDLLRLGARVVVELREQTIPIPRVAMDSASEEEGRNQAEHQQATHGVHRYRSNWEL